MKRLKAAALAVARPPSCAFEHKEQGRCPHNVFAKGACASHYRQLLRHDGDWSKLKPLRRQDGLIGGPKVRLNAAETRAMKRAAKAAGVSTYEWLRGLVRAELARLAGQ